MLIVLELAWCLQPQSAAAQANVGAAANPASATQNAATKPHDDTFIIGADDLLAINVWKEPDVSRTVPVRSDGMISLPLVGELQAAGKTPHQLEVAITEKLKNYISEPEVTVIVQEIRSQKFNVLGQVVRPGSYPLTNSTTVLDAIAIAGGFRDFAKQKNIYVLRQNPNGGESRLPFNYKDVIKGKDTAQNIRLQPRDTIVIP
ncbi:MAG: polysaccharide biosynthesis/export family protein [Terriglobales bacterium]